MKKEAMDKETRIDLFLAVSYACHIAAEISSLW